VIDCAGRRVDTGRYPERKVAMATVKDPVCGMEIDSEAAAATSDHEGTTYHFCAVGCKEEFDAEPAKFLGAAAEAAAEAPAEPPAAQEPAPVEAAPPAAPAPEGRKWWQLWRR
jgi:YHS domain-containing protein